MILLNKQLLLYHMAKNNDRYADLATALNVHKGTVGLKIKQAGFTQAEIKTIVDRYKLSADDIVEIFLR